MCVESAVLFHTHDDALAVFSSSYRTIAERPAPFLSSSSYLAFSILSVWGFDILKVRALRNGSSCCRPMVHVDQMYSTMCVSPISCGPNSACRKKNEFMFYSYFFAAAAAACGGGGGGNSSSNSSCCSSNNNSNNNNYYSSNNNNNYECITRA